MNYLSTACGPKPQSKTRLHNAHQQAATHGCSKADAKSSNESTAQSCYSPPDVAPSRDERQRPLASEACPYLPMLGFIQSERGSFAMAVFAQNVPIGVV